MGGMLCRHWRRGQGHPEEKSEAESCKSKSTQGSMSMTIIELMKPECIRTKKMKRERSMKSLNMNPPEKMIMGARKLTLEEWLLNSPVPNSNETELFNGGELYVFKHFSRRVHPSLSSSSQTHHEAHEPEDAASTSKPRDILNCSLDFSASSCSSLSRSQSGKSKKRVSFRQPEEADVIIFYSPEEVITNGHN